MKLTKMKKNKCSICSKNKFKKVINSHLLKVYECLNCGLYMVPQKRKNEKKESEYFKNYDIQKYINYYEGFRKKIYRNNWKTIKKWKKAGKSLDFGSSFGWFLEVAPRGWKAYGVEPASIAIDCQKKGLNVLKGSENEVKKFETKFDLVSMWNVIEHLPDPLKTLKRLSLSMTDNSIFAVAFPNRDGFYNRIAYILYFASFGKISKPLHVLFQADNPVPHLHHFRIKDIESLMEKAGYEVIQVEAQKIVDSWNLWKRQEVSESLILKYFVVPAIVLADTVLDKLRLNNDEIVVYARKINR